MTYNDLMETIRNSEREDWLHDDPKGVWTHRGNLDIRIERRRSETAQPFNEDWATCHSQPLATSDHFDIYYRSSFVESFMLVSVDEAHGADLPLPEVGTKVIPYNAYRLAVQVSNVRLDEYIERSGLTVLKP